VSFLEYRPITARPVGLATRTYRLARRNPGYSAFFALLFLVMLGGPLFFGIQQKLSNIEVRKALKQSEDERIAKEDALRRVEEELVLSNEVTLFLEDLFKMSDPNLALGKNITAYEILQKGAASIDSEFRDQPEIRVRLITVMANAFNALGDFELGERMLKDALNTCVISMGEDHALSVPALYQLGEIYHIMDRNVEAESMINRVLAVTRDCVDRDEIIWNLKATNLLASLGCKMGNFEEAENLFRDSWKRSEETLGEMHMTTIECMMYLGQVYSDRKRLDEAESLLSECLDRCLETGGEDDWHTAYTSIALGSLYHKMGKLNEAESLLVQVSERSRRVYGDMGPPTHVANTRLAALYMKMKQYEEAELLLKGAVECFGEKMGDHHTYTLDSIRRLAQVYMITDRPEQAELLARETLERIPGDASENKQGRAMLNDIIRKAGGMRGEEE